MCGSTFHTSRSCSVLAVTTHRKFILHWLGQHLSDFRVFSTIFTLQENRSSLRILGGITGSPRLHMLNGFVDTPLFRHLGSSSWHNFDASLINWVGHLQQRSILVGVSFVVSLMLTVYFLTSLRRRRCAAKRNRSMADNFDSEGGMISCVKDA